MPPINSGCGCCAELPLHPTNRDRCRSSLDVTTIGELVWLQGLDSSLCERFQRLTDVLHLVDCIGNPVSINTPLVTCAAFKDKLCAIFAGMAYGGVADETTQLVGADCKVYTIPQGGVVPNETPNTVTDSSSIDLTASGLLGRNIGAAVKISSAFENALVIDGTGLYVPSQDVPLTTCEQIGNMTNGGDAVPGTVLVGGDCVKYTFPAAATLSVNDSASIDLTLVANVLSAALRLDPDSVGRITVDGLEITCADIVGCAPPVTVTDTSTVDLTLAGQALSATVKLSAGINDITAEGDGLQVDICARLAALPGPTPAVIGVTELVGSDCNTYTLPTSVPVTVSDTTTLNLQLAVNDISGTVIVQPNTLLTVGPQGLAVTCEDVQDCIWTTPSNFFSYNDALPFITFVPSTDAGNQIINGTDGRPYVAPDIFLVDDTDCINLSFIADTLTAVPIISPNAGNALSCTATGLYAATAPEMTLVGGASDCAIVSVIEGPTDTFTITAIPTVSVAVGNQLTCTPAGLFVPSSGGSISVDDTDCINLTLAAGVLTADPVISPTVGNQLTCTASGLYVPTGAETPLTVTDTNSINLTASGVANHTLSADVNISAAPPNTVQILPDGLFVLDTCGQIQSFVDIGAIDLAEFRFVGEMTDGLGNITCHVGLLEEIAQGLLQCDGTALPTGATVLQPSTIVQGGVTTDPSVGFVVPNGTDCPQQLMPPTCDDTIPYHRTSSLILGENQTTPGTFQFQRSGNSSSVVTVATLEVNTVGFANNANIFLVNRDGTGSIILDEPAGACAIHEVWIKNIGNDPLVVNSALSTIDGVAAITLAGQDPGNYPYGNNGGESVHLIFDDNTTQWYVI